MAPHLCQLLTAPGIHTASEQEQTSALRSQLDELEVLYMLIFCPAHYTMLRIQLSSPTAPVVEWFGSLPDGHSTSQECAQRALAYLIPANTPALPPSVCPPGWAQNDGWSCGFHVLQWLELMLRRDKGEPPVPFRLFAAHIKQGNQFIEKVQRARVQVLTSPPQSL